MIPLNKRAHRSSLSEKEQEKKKGGRLQSLQKVVESSVLVGELGG